MPGINWSSTGSLRLLCRIFIERSTQSRSSLRRCEALALAQARLGNYGLAESYYRKAIDSAPTSDAGHYSALVNLSILLLLEHDPARLEEGLSYSQRAEKPYSLNRRRLIFSRARRCSNLDGFGKRVTELARAAKLNPEDSKPHFLLARIYDQFGQHDRARKERQNIARIQGRPGQAGMATVNSVPVTPE